MRISCVCLTFGRTALLEEALESFLRQDYPDKELVIFNTLVAQKLQFSHPQVKVVNHPARPSTIGETRNLAIEACSGELLLTYDDDDIYRGHYLSWLVGKLNQDWLWVKQASKFSMKDGRVQKMSGQANNQFMFSRTAWRLVGAYPTMDCGEDITFFRAMREKVRGGVVPCQPSEIGFIYRFNEGQYSLSSFGRNQPGKLTGLQACARKLVKRGVPRGVVKLNPHWRHDYERIVREWIKVNV